MNEIGERAMIAAAALNILPRSIRSSLLMDDGFVRTHQLPTDAVVSLANGAITVNRSQLFGAIRSLNRGAGGQLTDVNGRDWKVSLRQEGPSSQLLIRAEDVSYRLPDLYPLLGDSALRTQPFDSLAESINLPEPSRSEWRKILENRSLLDHELLALHKDLSDTPVRVSQKISAQLASGEASISSLVPASQRYYERLVGPRAQAGLWEHAKQVVGPHIRTLLAWRGFEGLLGALPLCSHAAHSDQIALDSISLDDMTRCYEWLQNYGDLISQVGAVEVGIRMVKLRPELEPYLINITQRVASDDLNHAESRFNLLSATILLVDGEIARLRIFADEPPFWRRLASIAHASIIERCINAGQFDFSGFSGWARDVRGAHFHAQTLSDLRTEPRWIPAFAAAYQLKAELVGRIVSAARLHADDLSESARDAFLGPTSVPRIQLPQALFPGPLEGASPPLQGPPPELSREIEKSFSAEAPQTSDFSMLVSTSLIYRLNQVHADIATRGLRAARQYLGRDDPADFQASLLAGLAHFAATLRHTALAKEVCAITRQRRNMRGGPITDTIALEIGLIAAAAHADKEPWCEAVGNWLAELAFSCSNAEEASALKQHLELLCRGVPALWTTCGRAEAALSAFLHDKEQS